MLFSLTPPVATSTKKVIYLILCIILGILLSFLLHAFMEFKYLEWAMNNNHTIVWYGGCALHPALKIGLLLAGIIGGFFLGKFWWRKVYIEQYWYKKFNRIK